MSPRVVTHLVFYRTLYSQSGVSLTMSSLAAYLRQQGHRATLNFFERRGLRNLDSLDLSAGWNVIIAKPNFKDHAELLPLLAELKRSGRVSRVWLCGTFASLNAADLMSKLDWLDGIIIGQPEETVDELLRSLTDDQNWDVTCPGGIWRHPPTGNITPVVTRTARISLNDLPFPARDLEAQESGNHCNIEAARGCRYKCTFCHVTTMTDLDRAAGFHDVRQPELVVDEIEQVHRRLGKTLFTFNDPTFWGSRHDDSRILRFCAEIERRHLDIRFYAYLRCAPLVGEKVLAAMARAGLTRVFLGVETVSEQSQAVFHKHITPHSYEYIKKLFDRYDINIHIGFITIEPFSTLDDVWRNLRYLHQIDKLFRIGVITESVRIVPGTHFHQQLLQSGLLPNGLSYDQLTYGYRFARREVGELHRGFQHMFRQTVADEAYAFEYHVTTAHLLRVLAIRLDERFRTALAAEYAVFCDLSQATMDLLLGYCQQSVERAATGATATAIGGLTGNERFVERFRQLNRQTQVTYADLRRMIINHGGARAVREVYTGEDRL